MGVSSEQTRLLTAHPVQRRAARGAMGAEASLGKGLEAPLSAAQAGSFRRHLSTGRIGARRPLVAPITRPPPVRINGTAWASLALPLTRRMHLARILEFSAIDPRVDILAPVFDAFSDFNERRATAGHPPFRQCCRRNAEIICRRPGIQE